MKRVKLILSLIFFAGSTMMLKAQTANRKFSPFGKWRGVIQLNDTIQIPFNFEIKGSSPANAKVYLLNGEERFETGSYKIVNDSIFIPLDQFDNELAFKISADGLNGFFRKQDMNGVNLPVHAEPGLDYRFEENGPKPEKDFSGKYEVTIWYDDTNEKGVGIFKQTGNKLNATFLRTTGDARFLEGIVKGDRFYVSAFIGANPVYYQGRIDKDGKITGESIGVRGQQTFSGKYNENAELPDLYSITNVKPGYGTFDFTLPDMDGKMVSLKDEKFRNKVVIITITGTWCPNCVDEAAYLSPWYKQNKKRGVEIVAIHFERRKDSAHLKKVMKRFEERFDIQYDQLVGGMLEKGAVTDALPALDSFLSYPTLIFVDKNKKVSKVYTGYSGPATGKYYVEFKKEFNEEVDRLLKQ